MYTSGIYICANKTNYQQSVYNGGKIVVEDMEDPIIVGDGRVLSLGNLSDDEFRWIAVIWDNQMGEAVLYFGDINDSVPNYLTKTNISSTYGAYESDWFYLAFIHYSKTNGKYYQNYKNHLSSETNWV